MPEAPLRVAIVGSGPAGFYTAEHLLRQERPVTVDLFDRLPTPFGLVRGGVAPDHPKIKSVTRIYDKVATHSGFRFFGNVTAGRDVTADDLARHYHAVVWAIGAEADRRLEIPGENLPGSHTATEFVGWYNGHPDFRDRRFDLSQESAAVIGVGNVAMDVTRILASDPEELTGTDIAAHALAALRESRVRTIYLLGRRGPAQAAFTNPELKEFGELAQADVVVRPADLDLDPATRAGLEATPDREAEKNLKTLRGFVERGLLGRARRIELRFCTSPVRLEGEERVERIVLGSEPPRSRPAGNPGGADRRGGIGPGGAGFPLGRVPGAPDGRVCRSTNRVRVIPNDRGRVLTGPGGAVVPGRYVAGWIKRGPSGVIGTNKPDAAETAERLLEDAAQGPLPVPAEPGPGGPAPAPSLPRHRPGKLAGLAGARCPRGGSRLVAQRPSGKDHRDRRDARHHSGGEATAMKIYTRTGDEGETGLFGGGRVSKAHPRVAAYGDVDELNAALGVGAGERPGLCIRRAARAGAARSLCDRWLSGHPRSGQGGGRAGQGGTAGDTGGRLRARHGRGGRGTAPSQGVRPARRHPAGGCAAPRQHHLPASGAERGAPGERRRGSTAVRDLSQPPLRSSLHPRPPGQSPVRRGRQHLVAVPDIRVPHALGAYDVTVRAGALDDLADRVRTLWPDRTVALITDETVRALLSDRLAGGPWTLVLSVPPVRRRKAGRGGRR